MAIGARWARIDQFIGPGSRWSICTLADFAIQLCNSANSVSLQPDCQGVMPEYRAYFVGADGIFVGFEPMICRDDAEAITSARRLLNHQDIEVWNCERFVLKLEAKKGT